MGFIIELVNNNQVVVLILRFKYLVCSIKEPRIIILNGRKHIMNAIVIMAKVWATFTSRRILVLIFVSSDDSCLLSENLFSTSMMISTEVSSVFFSSLFLGFSWFPYFTKNSFDFFKENKIFSIKKHFKFWVVQWKF